MGDYQSLDQTVRRPQGRSTTVAIGVIGATLAGCLGGALAGTLGLFALLGANNALEIGLLMLATAVLAATSTAALIWAWRTRPRPAIAALVLTPIGLVWA